MPPRRRGSPTLPITVSAILVLVLFLPALLVATGASVALSVLGATRNSQGNRSSAPALILTPYHTGGVYDRGERVGWKVTLPEGAALPTEKVHYTVKENNFTVIQSGDLDLSGGQATIETGLSQPGMLYLEVSPPGSTEGQVGRRPRPIVAGAAVDPINIKPVAPRPRDFDAFWKSKIKELESVPARPSITEHDSGMAGVDYATIQMDHVNGDHVYGQLAKPHRDGKFPAVLLLQWASPPYALQREWVTGLASQGWLVLNIEPHDVLPTEPQSYYDALPQALKNYSSIGMADRDNSYFVKMYQADYRAAEYLAGRPDWDGKTLVVMGTSMGGQQSLCVAGLDSKITHLIVDEPAGCDMNGPLHGRAAGYPNFPSNDPRVMEAAQYVDAVNFAPKITATSLVAMGFVDTVAPPVGIWTAFNLIRGKKEAATMVDSPHNNTATPEQQYPYTHRSREWLDALVKGKELIIYRDVSSG